MPDQLYEPRPGADYSMTMPNKATQQTHPQQSTNDNPSVQNVFQFNVRVSNGNMGSATGINFQPDLVPPKQPTVTKVRRPASSKHRGGTLVSNVFNTSNTIAATSNAYSANQPARRVSKKRPVSAKRDIFVNLSSTNASTAIPAHLFKSPVPQPGQKKNSLMPASFVDKSAGTGLPSMVHSNGDTQMIDLQSAPFSNFHPYAQSLKAVQPAQTSSKASAGRKLMSGHKAATTSVFASPDKILRVYKAKIPNATLQSREDLYEQNMHTKMEINSLRTQNRKINTKLMMLENQLAQKDKLFEDMYRAAFANLKYPATQQPMPTSPGVNASVPNPNHPIVLNAKAQQAVAGKKGPGVQQLINSYKRTIREQSKELEQRDYEIDVIKRSLKATQINQVLIENETYKTECVRLRSQIEMMLVQEQRQRSSSPKKAAFSEEGQSTDGTFKRDLTNPISALEISKGHSDTDKQTAQQKMLENYERLRVM